MRVQCSAECGRGQRTREVACLSADDRVVPENKCEGSRPKSMELCDMGSCAKTWFFSRWSDTVCKKRKATFNVLERLEAQRV